MIRALHHVQLACPAGSEGALRAFYGGLLGLAEVAKPPVLAARGGVWFRGPGVELHLGVEPDFRPARRAHPALLVDGAAGSGGLDGLAGRLEAAGHPVTWDPNLPGYRRFHCADPNGNRLELLEELRPDR